jgi:hypothetical protein
MTMKATRSPVNTSYPWGIDNLLVTKIILTPPGGLASGARRLASQKVPQPLTAPERVAHLGYPLTTVTATE